MPRVIRYQGKLANLDGSPRSGTVGVSFSIYADQQGGAPLWQEVQNVVADEQGRYTALLGAMHAEGLPADLFANFQARWLGIRVENEQEQPRILLAAVPYAMKAADAETLGGKPLSAFVLNDGSSGGGQSSISQGSSGITSSSSSQLHATSINTSTSTGTQGHLALWTDNAGTLGDSVVVQSNGMIGVGKVPSLAALDVVSAGNAVAVDSSATSFSALIATSNGGNQVAINNMNGDMGFFTASGEVARFNSVGMGVRKVASLATLDVNGSGAFAGRGLFTTAQSFAGNVSTLHVTDNSPVAGNVGGGVVLGGTYTGTSTTEFAAMVASKDNAIDGSYGGGLGFYTRADGSGAWTPKTDARMFISSAGNVGIGNASPAAKLDVTGNINATGTINASNLSATGTTTLTGQPTGTGVGQGALYVNPASATSGQALLGVAVNGTEKMLVDGSGNLSIAGTINGNGAGLANVAAASVGTVPAVIANLRLITYLGGCDSCSVLTTSDNQKLIYQNLFGSALTFQSITCYSDAGTPNINLQRDTGGSTANVTASAIPCSTAGSTTSSFSVTTLNVNDKLNFLMSAPDGVARRVTVIIKATL